MKIYNIIFKVNNAPRKPLVFNLDISALNPQHAWNQIIERGLVHRMFGLYYNRIVKGVCSWEEDLNWHSKTVRLKADVFFHGEPEKGKSIKTRVRITQMPSNQERGLKLGRVVVDDILEGLKK